jgi:predicted transposase YbfD/YdcC
MLLCEAQTIQKKVQMESNTEGIVLDVGSLYTQLSGLKDKRKAKGLRYSLVDLLVLMTLAKLCGQDNPSGIGEWVKNRGEQLQELLKLKRKTMPHHSTYRRIAAEVVDVEELERMVHSWFGSKVDRGQQIWVSMDGKVLRGTLDDQQKGTYLLAAYLPSQGLVLMEIAIPGKGNEIAGAVELLKRVDLRHTVVIGDALHTQREVSAQIVEAGGDYVWFAKGNQPQMEANIRLWFDPEPNPIPGAGNPPKDFEIVSETNKGHGRIEERTLTVSSQLKDFLDWPGLEQVFKLERHFTSTKTGQTTQQVVYGFTSLTKDEASSTLLLHKTRSYWGIENGLHYRRDVTLQEDRTRMTKGHAGQFMACLNNIILGLLAGYQKQQFLPAIRRYFDAHPDEAFSLISRL